MLRLFLEINICELLAVVVPHNEAGIVVFLDGPWRWKRRGLPLLIVALRGVHFPKP